MTEKQNVGISNTVHGKINSDHHPMTCGEEKDPVLVGTVDSQMGFQS